MQPEDLVVVTVCGDATADYCTAEICAMRQVVEEKKISAPHATLAQLSVCSIVSTVNKPRKWGK